MRKAMAILAALFVATLVWVVVPAGPAQACSCLEPESAQALLDQADVVFDGVALDVRDEGVAVWRFDVDQALKGTPADPQEVRTVHDSAACGVSFEIGVAYRVFAMTTAEGGLSTLLCSGTMLLSEVAPEPGPTSSLPIGPKPSVTSPVTTAPVPSTLPTAPTTLPAVTTTLPAVTLVAPDPTSVVELAGSEDDGGSGVLVAAGVAVTAALVLGFAGFRLRARRYR